MFHTVSGLHAPSAHVKGDPERQRLREASDGSAPWYRWGPYLAERQWGTVREDYSPDGRPWEYFPHDHARSRAYRWGEDGLLGISDDRGLLCFALALWNEADPILKERLFGLSGTEGNHGEDVKEVYYYLDNTPTHSYMKALYRYPQRAFPYAQLVEENARRSRDEAEYELVDTNAFAENRFWDVLIEYAKVDPEDVLVRISATNQGPQVASLRIVPQIWYRNTWAWGRADQRPSLRAGGSRHGARLILADHPVLGSYGLAAQGSPRLLFTENDTNFERLWGLPNSGRHVKDGIDEAIVHGRLEAVNPDNVGTKAAAEYALRIEPGSTSQVLLRLERLLPAAATEMGVDSSTIAFGDDPFRGAGAVFSRRREEADTFYGNLGAARMPEDERIVQREAFAGLLWGKQFYHYNVAEWLDGDPAFPPPPAERRRGRNAGWREHNSSDVLSMPDTWEYPWYAAWDLAFQCIPLAQIDPEFAKSQLILLTREWYMHPNGQLPACEWAFSEVNPPVHAWASWRVYKIDQRITGRSDRAFLERVFHKLLLNFTWWVNRKDAEGNNVFQGGFLGLDNIGPFDRSGSIPAAAQLGQADGTAWMGMYSLTMLAIALELAREDIVYEDVATKFLEHFLYIAGALNGVDVETDPLWDDQDEFFYDSLRTRDGRFERVALRSLVGLIPLLAVETLEPALLDAVPAFKERLGWFLANRPDLAHLVASWETPGQGQRRLLALVHGHRLKALLRRMLDPQEFLSDHGVRSVSRYHLEHPYVLRLEGVEYRVGYDPGESRTGIFGGNSNWRGPVWFPINYLLIEALQKFDHYYGDDFRVECPTGSGHELTLWQVAEDLSRRLVGLFVPGPDGRRPFSTDDPRTGSDPLWANRLLFHEYFHGDSGAGLGASHQTGWTAVIAKLLDQLYRPRGSAGDGRSALLWSLPPERIPGAGADEQVRAGDPQPTAGS